MTTAKHVLSLGILAGILDTVRTRVLEFALEIEKANPEAGEASLHGVPPVPPEKVERIVNVTVYGGQQSFGDGATFQVAGRDFVISSAFPAEQQQQLKSMLEELHKHLPGVHDDADRQDATDALVRVETEIAKAQPKPGRIKTWLGAYARFVPVAAETVKLVEQIVALLK